MGRQTTGGNALAASRPTISTHVLDVERGLPAVGVPVAIFQLDANGGSRLLGEHETDADGRIADLLDGAELRAGDYQLVFDLAASGGERAYFAGMAIGIHVVDTARGHHVPLLLAPYSMTTYRGS